MKDNTSTELQEHVFNLNQLNGPNQTSHSVADTPAGPGLKMHQNCKILEAKFKHQKFV